MKISVTLLLTSLVFFVISFAVRSCGSEIKDESKPISQKKPVDDVKAEPDIIHGIWRVNRKCSNAVELKLIEIQKLVRGNINNPKKTNLGYEVMITTSCVENVRLGQEFYFIAEDWETILRWSNTDNLVNAFCKQK